MPRSSILMSVRELSSRASSGELLLFAIVDDRSVSLGRRPLGHRERAWENKE
jgi:hypothetical protein